MLSFSYSGILRIPTAAYPFDSASLITLFFDFIRNILKRDKRLFINTMNNHLQLVDPKMVYDKIDNLLIFFLMITQNCRLFNPVFSVSPFSFGRIRDILSETN